jgi:3'-5' exoribonuclease
VGGRPPNLPGGVDRESMMPQAPVVRRTIVELKAGEHIEDEIYRISQKDLRTTNNGGLYIHVVLADKTGQMLARMWNASQAFYENMPEGGFLRFKGRVESYKGNLQFIIDGAREVEPGAIDLADFLPKTTQDIDAMWNRVLEILRTIQNRDLLALVGRFVKDEPFVSGFKRAPAATQLHHAYIGGLLEHTLNLMELALLVLPRYPKVSLDLVLAGIFLHDAGKVGELYYETNFGYTSEGQLVGHIVQAVIWIHEKIAAIEAETGKPFPPAIATSLKHIILSHHGKFEFGSPKLPATPESIAVHYLDNLDAKLHQYLAEIEKDTDTSSEFTEYVRTLETKIYKPDVMGIRPKK